MYNRRFPSLRTPASGKRLNSYPNHDSNHSRKVITSYDNFSVKILPAGLEIFTENRRLDLAFPSNPGITFAPRTKMTD